MAWGKARTTKLEYYVCILAVAWDSPCVYFSNLPNERQRFPSEARLARDCGPSQKSIHNGSLSLLEHLPKVRSRECEWMSPVLGKPNMPCSPFPQHHSKLRGTSLSNTHHRLEVGILPTTSPPLVLLTTGHISIGRIAAAGFREVEHITEVHQSLPPSPNSLPTGRSVLDRFVATELGEALHDLTKCSWRACDL